MDNDAKLPIRNRLYGILICLALIALLFFFPWMKDSLTGALSASLWQILSLLWRMRDAGRYLDTGAIVQLMAFALGALLMLALAAIAFAIVLRILRYHRKPADLTLAGAPVVTTVMAVLMIGLALKANYEIREYLDMSVLSVPLAPIAALLLSVVCMALQSGVRNDAEAQYLLNDYHTGTMAGPDRAQPDGQGSASLQELPITVYDTSQRLQPLEVVLDSAHGTICLLLADYQADRASAVRALRANIMLHTIFDDEILLRDVSFLRLKRVEGRYFRTDPVQIELPPTRLKEICSVLVEPTRIVDGEGSAAVRWRAVPSPLSPDELVSLRKEWGKDAFRRQRVTRIDWDCVCGGRNPIANEICARCGRPRDGRPFGENVSLFREADLEKYLRIGMVSELLRALEASEDMEVRCIGKDLEAWREFYIDHDLLKVAQNEIRSLIEKRKRDG